MKRGLSFKVFLLLSVTALLLLWNHENIKKFIAEKTKENNTKTILLSENRKLVVNLCKRSLVLNYIDSCDGDYACDFTTDPSAAENSDAIIYDFFKQCYEGAHPNEHWLNVSPEARRRQVWIVHFYEPPHDAFHGCYDHNRDFKDIDNRYNWTMSHRSDSNFVTGYDFRCFYEKSETKLFEKSKMTEWMNKKQGLTTWLVSHCRAYSAREDYVDILKKFTNVEVFGNCNEKPYNSDTDTLLATFKFYLSFESSLCDDYVTEKFFRVLKDVPVVPIVMGETREWYEKRSPPHSFIHVDDFSSPQDLAKYLNYLDGNNTAYQEYLNWRLHYVHKCPSNVLCDVCKKLYEVQGPGHNGLIESKVQVIENFSKYWYQKKCLREKDIPWEFQDPPRSSKLASYDPRDTLLLTTN